jgi:Peptidase A4 family
VCRDPFPDVNRDLSVVGQWTVPTVTAPANHRQAGPILGIKMPGWDSSSWIGIDGFSTDSSDVLQAGVQHYVLQSGESVYLPWFEWYVPQEIPGDPDYIHQTRITNFDVQPGDSVSCNVSYVSHQFGQISFHSCPKQVLALEAQRLGLEAHGSDLNPVAVLITKALIEIPPKFAGQPPVNPAAKKKMSGKGMWTGARGLADDVRYYGQWMRDRALAENYLPVTDLTGASGKVLRLSTRSGPL